ncbi:MAG: sulfatase-like hydrolase/transferase [Bacteroidia bacterium]|nr:sulfatase-like hydrolase/transferase [Bacteroidia bacterium]MBT8276345.1 sulfatase-like hydrolase/transferase [Bacteroidia bacterium]NNF32361.1 sulfatase-like hydrolase/transferase [Flavobacteriaceae bacterium]NNK53237.1 sulfatase-like hydrolase/transferase [Flavobacteriaceae bacterium]NNM09451.1 sulfatase-like hydrolase/transferase [Flavobacteriaceae bacterium]
MNLKRILFRFLIISLPLLLVSCEEREEPNIVFIIADDMYPHMFNNISDTTADGEKPNLTPALDRLAQEGVWLDNMKVVSPLCTPSRYNVLTGNFASRATNSASENTAKRNDGQRVIQWNSFIVPGNERTMGNYFQALGYKTGFVGKNHVIESPAQIGGNTQPDLNANIKDPKVKEALRYRYAELQKDIQASGFDYADGLYHNNTNWSGVKALNSHNMDWIAEKGIEFIDQNKNKPFMLYFAATLPHGPTNARQSWEADRRLTPLGRIENAPNVLPRYKGELPEKHDSILAKYPGMEATIRSYESINKRLAEKGQHGRDKANLLWLDDAVGALFNKLEEENLLDNTIIVFFNDHGQELKGTLYEGGVNSQAYIWKKGGFEIGNVMETPVSNVDFLPTLLDLAGYKQDLNNFDGYSFKPALEGKEYTGRTSMYHELGYARAIVKDNLKYYTVRYPEWAMNLSYEKRLEMLNKQNAFKEKFGLPSLTADPMAPFGHLVMIPGGELVENPAYISMPNYTEPNQFYDLTIDPEEKNNLFNDPRYADKVIELREELRKKLEKLPGNYPIDQGLTNNTFKN